MAIRFGLLSAFGVLNARLQPMDAMKHVYASRPGDPHRDDSSALLSAASCIQCLSCVATATREAKESLKSKRPSAMAP